MIKHIVAEDLANLRVKLLDVIKREKYFQCDVCTGNYKINCGDIDMVCTPEKAFDYFAVFFGDKCLIRTETTASDGSGRGRTQRVSKDDLRSVFRTIGEVAQYNSREEMFKAIPKWDGIPRIDSFLKAAYDCTTNPHFFRLYLTAIVGKMHDPKNTYVPFFFDFVGKKGVGKSLLHQFLVGEEHVIEIEPTSRQEEVLAQIYAHNAIIAIDDECLVTGKGEKGSWSENKLKAFVTRNEDVFSRKFMMAEQRVRSFVLVRTSNTVKSSTDPDERRQIIFECKLPPRVCRLWDYGKENYIQLMAEAKDYYLKYGVYKLTKEDWEDVVAQQSRYFNDEESNYVVVRKFIEAKMRAARNDPTTVGLHKLGGYFVVQWIDFEEYRINDLHSPTKIQGEEFWKLMRGLESKTGKIKIVEGDIRGSHVLLAQLLTDREPIL